MRVTKFYLFFLFKEQSTTSTTTATQNGHFKAVSFTNIFLRSQNDIRDEILKKSTLHRFRIYVPRSTHSKRNVALFESRNLFSIDGSFEGP